MPEDTQLRDNLAIERTRLANERTYLAYVRTALALLAGGAAVFHFFPDQNNWTVLAWVLMLAGAATVVGGTYRFLQVRKRLGGRDEYQQK